MSVPPTWLAGNEERSRVGDLEQVEAAGARQDDATRDPYRGHLTLRQRVLRKPPPRLQAQPGRVVRAAARSFAEGLC